MQLDDVHGTQLRQTPSLERSLGLALWWAWIWLMFFPGNAHITPDMSILGWWSVSLLGSTLAASIACLYPSIRQTTTTPGVSSVAAVGCAACTLALFALHGVGFIPAVCLAFVACFFSTFWGAHAVMQAVSSDPRIAVAQVAGALFMGSVLYLLTVDRVFGIEAFLVTLLPLLALLLRVIQSREAAGMPVAGQDDPMTAAFVLGCSDKPFSEGIAGTVEAGSIDDRRRVAPQGRLIDRGDTQRRLLAIAIFACAATFGVFGGLVTDAGVTKTDQTMMVGIALLSLGVWVVALVRPQAINGFAMYFSTIPFYVLGMVVLIASVVYARELETVSVLFVIMGWACSLVFGWSFFVVDENGVLDERGPMLCILLIQAGTLAGTLLMVAANLFGLSDSHRLAMPMFIIILLVFLLVGAVFVLLRSITRDNAASLTGSIGGIDAGGMAFVADTPTSQGMSGAFDSVADVAPVPFALSVAEFAGQLTRDHGLSERESEILEPLLRGYSLPKIADELGVAKSTVATHAQHIYRKVGVHSRQELIELLDEEQA